ncbi:MAG TPA: hypothetical protein VK348_09340, partial [Planctomycetota bacterium]|nr:hypothetical protein [Planctomycetota bacterium]
MLPFATTRTYCLRAGCCAGAVLAIAIARSPAQVAPTAPAAHWTVSGRCLGDEGGAPLAGCTIVVEGFQATGYPLAWSWLDWRDPEPVVTGGDGRFTFTLSVQPGRGFGDGYPSRIHLTIRAPGRVGVFGTRHLSTFFDHAAQDFGDFRLPRGVAPHVRVVDSAGVLQRDVELRVTAHSQRRRVAEPDREPAPGGDWWWFERNLAARTDAQGQALDDTPLDPGRYGLKVGNRSVRSGDGTFVIADPVAATAPITVVVEPVPVAQTAAGRVVDGDDHPVAGYVLYAVGKAKDTRNVEWITTRTIADGSFLLVAAGKNLNDDFELKHPRNNRYDEWQSFGGQVWGKQGLLIKLARRASLQLAVTAVGIGPITDLAVQALPVDPLLPGADPVRLSGTFTGGIVCIDNLRKGRYLVRVHARGSDLWPSPWRECEASAEPTLVPIELPAPVARTLHVFTDQGRPVVGGRVELVFGAKAP